MRKLIEESSLTKIELDVLDNNVKGAVERITDWMEKFARITLIRTVAILFKSENSGLSLVFQK
jgi:hypothetical protein